MLLRVPKLLGTTTFLLSMLYFPLSAAIYVNKDKQYCIFGVKTAFLNLQVKRSLRKFYSILFYVLFKFS